MRIAHYLSIALVTLSTGTAYAGDPSSQNLSSAEAAAAGTMDQAALEASLKALKLPAIEGLTATSDYIAFMAAEVPEEIRVLALRKLWGAMAVQNVTDEATPF